MNNLGLICIGFVFIAATTVLAALPPRMPEQLRADADSIVTGSVTAVYTRLEKRDDEIVDTIYLIELKSSAVEKGKEIKAGQVVYARTWQPHKRPSGMVGPQGQNEIPEEGGQVRLYLSGSTKEGWTILEPNGLELVGIKK